MEFIAGTIVGVISTVIAYLALRAQLKQTDKRLHYVRFISPIIASRDELTTEVIKLYQHGQQLINPHIYVVKIQNSGNAPIVPDDFDGAIAVRLNESIFVSGSLSWNRPDMLQEKKHDLDMSTRELRIGPMLLNPGDALTLIALVEAASDDLSVIGRLAGVEQIVQIPPSDWMGHLRFVNEGYAEKKKGVKARETPLHTKLPSKALDCMRFNWPVLANPNGQAQELLNDLEVKVNGVTTKQPTMFIYGMTNTYKGTLLPSDFGGPLMARSRKSIFRHAYVRKSRPGAEGQVLPIEVAEHEVRVEPPLLEPNEGLSLTVIVDGPGDDLDISTPSIPVIITLPLVADQQSPLTVKLDYDQSLVYRLGRFLGPKLSRRLGRYSPRQ